MRLVSVDKLNSEVRLAKTIYDSFGSVLLKKGTILTNSYLKSLKKLKIKSIYVDDGTIEAIKVDEAVSEETRLQVFYVAREALLNISEGNPIHQKKVEDAVNKLIDQILQHKDTMIHLIDIRSMYDHTFCHSVNVCILSIMTGLTLGYDELKLKELGIGALLHDIGKAKLLEVVNSERKLTEQCYQLVQKHCDLGYEVLSRSNIDIFAAEVARQHHERYNGKGYPRGLSGKGILEYARIVAIADVYDALISDRPYRDRIPPNEVINMIRSGAGTDFDPDIVDKFISNVAPFPIGTRVRLNTGLTGVVVGIKKNVPEKPIIKLLYDHTGKPLKEVKIVELDYNDKFAITEVLVE